MTALVGYTGFVGSNIAKAAGNEIQALYNSKNIQDAYGSNPDLLIYSGLRAEKYLANSAPDKDMELIVEAQKNIEKIAPRRLVLISTIDVFKAPFGVNEDSPIDTENLYPYGYNRYVLEQWVREHYPDALIIRLPGLFGDNIKKNFIYDFINVIPFMLKQEKMEELTLIDSEIVNYYKLYDNGFYKLEAINESDREMLKEKFRKIGFSALNFTDSRSRYQFYDLRRLWNDIKLMLDNNILLWHPATEPVSAGELYAYLAKEEFVNELSAVPANYDYRTIHGDLFGSSDGYVCSKEEILERIRDFVEKEQ